MVRRLADGACDTSWGRRELVTRNDARAFVPARRRREMDIVAVRTLVFHDGALGDALLSLPCISAMSRHSAPLDAVCRNDVGSLLRSSGFIERAFSSDSGVFSSWYAGYPADAAREMVVPYGRVFVFTRHEGSSLAMGIAAAVPDTQVIVTVPPAGERTHVAEFRLRQLPAALRDDAPHRLSVPSPMRQRARGVLMRAGHEGQGLIVLHPGSGGKRKCWPLERYFALAERLVERAGAFILFLSGPAEEPPVKGRIEQFVRARTGAAQVADADLPIVAGLLALCGLFVGNDSGISHLAAAAGAPVISLFGPTDPALWRPCGEPVRVIAAATMEDITVDAVLAAAEEVGVRAFSS